MSFELHGSAGFPGGLIGDTPYEENVRNHHANDYDGDIVWDQRMTWYHRFASGGKWTPVKAWPLLPTFSNDSEREFPPGGNIPQFLLTRKQQFVVIGLFGRRESCPRRI